MNEVFFVVEEASEGGFTAKALGESIFTEAETIEELRVNVKEAVECHFDADKMPKLIRLHLVKEEVIAV
jgi:predicted RNase H-like HicB family nuclease